MKAARPAGDRTDLGEQEALSRRDNMPTIELVPERTIQSGVNHVTVEVARTLAVPVGAVTVDVNGKQS